MGHAFRFRVMHRNAVIFPHHKESNMLPQKLRLYMAGLVAFLVGMPLTEKAFGSIFGDAGDIAGSAIDLGFSIANASAGDS